MKLLLDAASALVAFTTGWQGWLFYDVMVARLVLRSSKKDDLPRPAP